MIKTKSLLLLSGLLLFGMLSTSYAQKSRVGTAAATFLEIGYGSAGSAMGEAYTSVATDLSAQFWNPAGLGYMEQSEAQFTIQPWLVNINTSYAGVGLVLPTLGTLALGIYQTNYGEMDVTNMIMQEGTGEKFTAMDMAFAFSYSRKLAQWFSFGASAKYISSKIWHNNASAMAVDLGVLLDTNFFSPTGERAEGMKIGMSVSNYGTRLKYDGMDLLESIDILPTEEGNYKYAPGQFKTEGWELPLIFRVGLSVSPIVINNHKLIVAVDALHPNNNTESVNVGAQYSLTFPTVGAFYLRGGYKALFMEDSEYGPTFGGGLQLKFMQNLGLKLDYCYKDIGILGNIHSYSIGFLF